VRGVTAGLLVILGAASLSAEERSISDLYPALEKSVQERIFSAEGELVSTADRSGALILAPVLPESAPLNAVLKGRNPTFLIQSLRVIPYAEGSLDLLTVYRALSQVKNLSGYTYLSSSRGKEVPLFEDATRIENPGKNKPLADPPATTGVPDYETMFIRLKDANFGNSIYRADIQALQHGLLYTLRNEKSLNYAFFPVIAQGKFISILYVEPLSEGLFIYGVAAADVSSFVADKVHIPSAIRKRLAVITTWLSEGLGLLRPQA